MGSVVIQSAFICILIQILGGMYVYGMLEVFVDMVYKFYYYSINLLKGPNVKIDMYERQLVKYF